MKTKDKLGEAFSKFLESQGHKVVDVTPAYYNKKIPKGMLAKKHQTEKKCKCSRFSGYTEGYLCRSCHKPIYSDTQIDEIDKARDFSEQAFSAWDGVECHRRIFGHLPKDTCSRYYCPDCPMGGSELVTAFIVHQMFLSAKKAIDDQACEAKISNKNPYPGVPSELL